MRSTIMAAVLAISTLLAAAPAMASEQGGAHASNYPMAAQTFQTKVQTRETKARAHMEKRAAKLGADEAKALRAKFDAAIVKVDAEVAKVIADGTVTKDEAKEVRQVSKELGGHHHHHKGGEKKGERGQAAPKQ